MIKLIQELITSFDGKPTISTKEFKDKLNTLSQKLEKEINENSLVVVEGCSKLNNVDEIKPYDIIYVSLFGGIPHYILVHKIIDDKVYGLVLTSKHKDYLILHKVTEDRIFKDNFVSNTYVSITLEEAKKSFVRIYESKKEAIVIFNKIKKYYRNLFAE